MALMRNFSSAFCLMAMREYGKQINHNFFALHIKHEPNSAIGIATGYRLDD
jgi:hypothetical protein